LLDYGVLIAAAGFGLSLATGIITAYVGYRKDIHDQQAQLASVLQTIQELTFKQAEVIEKYKGTDFEPAFSKLLTTSLDTAFKTATRLALSLGSHATTSELVMIAQGLYGVGDPATIQRLLEQALSIAQSANDESFALRYLAFFKVRNAATPENRKEGEDLYARAMALDAKYNLGSLPYAVHFLKAVAAFDWASAIAPFDCDGAKKHFAEGVAELAANPRNVEMDQMRRAALLAYSEGIGGVPACKPSPQTVLSP
jgi:hypothetical protein